MTTWYVDNSTQYGGAVTADWQASHTYAVNNRVVVPVASVGTNNAKFVYQATAITTGVSGSTQPAWPTTVGNTVVDGGVTWTCRSPSDGNWGDASCHLWYMMYYGYTAQPGDTIMVHKAHAESVSNTTFYASPTGNNWMQLFCVDNTNGNALATGAVITGISSALVLERYAYCYGIQFQQSAASALNIGNMYQTYWILESNGTFDVLSLTNNATGCKIASNYSPSQLSQLDVINAGINLGYAANSIGAQGGSMIFRWKGGVLHAPNGVTTLLTTYRTYMMGSVIEDVDLTQVGSGSSATALIIVGVAQYESSFPELHRCKMPTASGFAYSSGSYATVAKASFKIHNCSAANAVEEFHESSYEGTTDYNTTVYGAASDGVNGFSFKMASSANAMDGILALESPLITAWNGLTGSHTFTINCILDSATDLTNADIWMELEYPVDATSGLGALITDRVVPLGAPANKSASTSAWTGTGTLTHPNKFECQVTATPGKAGPVTARILLSKPSITVYVDPVLVVV
jgi:hypothetical protein